MGAVSEVKGRNGNVIKHPNHEYEGEYTTHSCWTCLKAGDTTQKAQKINHTWPNLRTIACLSSSLTTIGPIFEMDVLIYTFPTSDQNGSVRKSVMIKMSDSVLLFSIGS